MYIENITEEDMPHALSNEDFPCAICFDSLSSKNVKEMATVKKTGNTSVEGYKVPEFLCMFLNHIWQTNISDHYTLPQFNTKCQSQVGNSCEYHAMIKIFTLTRFSWEYI